MTGNAQVRDRFQPLSPADVAPRVAGIALSVFAHLAGLALMIVPWRMDRARILPEKLSTARTIPVKERVPFKSAASVPAQPRVATSHQRSSKQSPVPAPRTAGDAAGLQILREHARQATAGLMSSLRSRAIYGIAISDYQLAVKTAGEIPIISASDLPPRFQQYVIVEVTIDIDGRVADARITAGIVSPNIEQTLLSAIREFRYNPAKHDGSPIPSQLDIVIHIPT